MTSAQQSFPCRRVGAGDQHHFFGYYNKSNWDCSGRYLLANQVSMMDAPLTPNMVARVGYFDLENGDTFTVVGETTAWKWQMGCQRQWLDGVPGRKVIYNVRTESSSTRYPGFGSVICDVDTGETQSLPMPVYVVAPRTSYALCVDYR